ncbi:hypothetical protein ACQPYH_04215 [Kribbella sp. CA-245084]|uniref:hypothetical protein n=1 Tax=Kribbella sp. CA-245084 TaxID=3239940 RepID=UPI003D8AA9D1
MCASSQPCSDDHGNKTIYAKAPAGAVIRHDATIAAIAEALKTFGDTRRLQHRRADAISIIADPRFTQELLTQAHNRPTPSTSSADTSSPAPSPGRQPAKASPEAAPGSRCVEAASQSAVSTRPAATGCSASSPRKRSNDTPSTPAEPTRGEAATLPASSASPSYDSPRDRSNRTPCTSADPARGDAFGLRGRSNDTPRTCADPDLGTNPVRAENPPYERPDAGDAHLASSLADALPGPMAEPVELREPPLAEGEGPYDPDPPSDPFDNRAPAYVPGPRSQPDHGIPMDTAAQRALDARLAQIKRDAYTNSINAADSGSAGAQVRPGQTDVFVHLTDLTLATRTGVLRAEGIGPLLADQLTELVGHGPYTVKPVIDLNDAVSVDAYEIPTRIRERVRLTYPVELFPYGTRETHGAIDLDHIQPYDPHGPAGQTSTTNLAPLSRFAHRVKTHAHGWNVDRVDHKTLEWTTPHGFTFQVDPTGTHRVPNPTPDN